MKDTHNVVGHPDRNWSEDFGHENGNYCNKCRQCGLQFRGHKRRTICRKCADAPVLTIPEEFNCFGYFGFGSGVSMARATPLRATHRPMYCNTCTKAADCWQKHRERVHGLYPDLSSHVEQLAGGKGGNDRVAKYVEQGGAEPFMAVMLGNIEDGASIQQGGNVRDLGKGTLPYPFKK